MISHSTPKLQSASKELIALLGAILLIVHMKNVYVKFLFGIVENLTVDILLSTPFIDQNTQSIISVKRKMVPWYSDPAPVLTKPETKEH